MDKMGMPERLINEMTEFDRGDPKRIQHFIKVHSFARLIGIMEGLDAHTLLVLECAAVLHDIGIHPAEEKYGSSGGKLQEQEGPIYARPMLEGMGVPEEDTDRICYLIGHHHTYDKIDGIDYQILVEADFLVNMYEDGMDKDAVRQVLGSIFRTASGREICARMFGVDEE